MAVKAGGSVARPGQAPLKKAADLSVKQLKGKLSSAGINNAGINDKAELAALAVRHEVI